MAMTTLSNSPAAFTTAPLPLLLRGSSLFDFPTTSTRRRRKRGSSSSSLRSSSITSLSSPDQNSYSVASSKLHDEGHNDADPPNSPNSGVVEILGLTSKHVAKITLAAAVASILILNPPEDAMAAKSGGRVGGQAFRSAPPPPRAGPRIDNSRRTNIYVNPPTFVAPPLYGNPFYGGYGWSPFSFFFPGPSVAIGVGGGFNFFSFFVFMIVASSIFNFFRRRNNDDDDDGDYY